jgi:uncharacterized delta-60 repeat protein
MRTPRLVTAAGLAIVGVAAWGTAAQAAPGSFDTTFGTGGVVQTDYNGPAPVDALLQPDGKIVVVAGFNQTAGATQAIGLLRYLPSGALDASFGTAGRASVAFTTFISTAADALLQPDGKIVVVGEAEDATGQLSEFAVARFTANGSLDSTFGTGGKVTTNFVGVMAGGVRNPATTVLLQSDGKLLVGGSASQCARCGTRTALARYTGNGSLDATFGTGGTVDLTAIGPVTAFAEDAAGDIFALNGATPAQFSAAGVVTPVITPAPVVSASSKGFATAPTVFQADGRFLLARTAAGVNRHDTDAQVARFQVNGAVDGTFVNPAFDFVNDGSPGSDVGQAITQTASGQVLVAGINNGNTGTTLFSVARLTATGPLDTTFGTGGAVVVSLPMGGQASVVLTQPDGRILVVGQGFTSSTTLQRVVIARLLPA